MRQNFEHLMDLKKKDLLPLLRGGRVPLERREAEPSAVLLRSPFLSSSV